MEESRTSDPELFGLSQRSVYGPTALMVLWVQRAYRVEDCKKGVGHLKAFWFQACVLQPSASDSMG